MNHLQPYFAIFLFGVAVFFVGLWFQRKERQRDRSTAAVVPKPEVLPNVCLEVVDKMGSTREIFCRTSSVSTSGILTLCDADGLVVAQYAAGFWKSTVVLEPKKPTPKPKQAVATQAAHAEVGEKAGELAISGPEGNSRA